MSGITTHSDSINGNEIELVLNAPYKTLATGNRLTRGNSVVSFCNRHSSNYAKVVGEQVWASPFKGILLSAFIEKNLSLWALDKAGCRVYVPLDTLIYSIEVSSFGTCVPGSEAIITYEDTFANSPADLHILSGGSLSSQFKDVIEIDHKELVQDFTFTLVDRELLRNRYFIMKHYVATAALFVCVGITLNLATRALINDEMPTVFETYQEILVPTGSDIAVSQLYFIDDLLSNGLDYFFGKGLTTITYDSERGITLEGNHPSPALLKQLIDDTGKAGLNLLIDEDGWQITKVPEIQLRQGFELKMFNENFQALKAVEERFGFSLGMDTLRAGTNRKVATVELSKGLQRKPQLAELARELVGRSVALEGLVVTIRGYQYEQLTLTLAVSGV